MSYVRIVASPESVIQTKGHPNDRRRAPSPPAVAGLFYLCRTSSGSSPAPANQPRRLAFSAAFQPLLQVFAAHWHSLACLPDDHGSDQLTDPVPGEFEPDGDPGPSPSTYPLTPSPCHSPNREGSVTPFRTASAVNCVTRVRLCCSVGPLNPLPDMPVIQVNARFSLSNTCYGYDAGMWWNYALWGLASSAAARAVTCAEAIPRVKGPPWRWPDRRRRRAVRTVPPCSYRPRAGLRGIYCPENTQRLHPGIAAASAG